MITKLTGRYEGIKPTQAEITVHGVTYAVNIPLSTFQEIDGHAEGALRIHHRFSQTGEQTLYGFYSEEERDMFVLLIGVNGVGPSAALNMLSIPVFDLQAAISNGQESVLVKIKGIGAKTAKQVVLDLKSKMPQVAPLELALSSNPHREDAVLVLIGMGQNKNNAQKIVDAVLEEGVTEHDAIIKRSLQMLSK